MVFSGRERTIAIGAAIAVALLLLDRIVISPLLNRQAANATQIETLRTKVDADRRAISQRERLETKWNQMVTSGLTSDPAAAEAQMRHALSDWARESGLSITRIRPERLTEKTALPQIAFAAEGNGNINALARFLWRIESSQIPIKVAETEVHSRKDGTDDLTFRLRLLTLYAPAQATAPAAAMASAPRTAAPLVQAVAFDAYKLVIDRNIFSRDRVGPRTVREYRPQTEPPRVVVTPADDEQSIVLDGTAGRADAWVAYFEDIRSGETRRLLVGEKIGDGTVTAISLDGIEYRVGDATRKIGIRQTLAGTDAILAVAAPPPVVTPPATTTQPASTGGPSGPTQPPVITIRPPATTGTPSSLDDVAERMRQRRLQEQR